MDINNVTLCGRLTNDPEVKELPNDNAVAKFGLAINRVWYNGEKEKKEETTFLSIETWGSNAKLAERYLNKGSEIGLIGRLATSTWEDKEDGSKKSRVYVVADRISFGAKPKSSSDEGENPSKAKTEKKQKTEKVVESEAPTKRAF